MKNSAYITASGTFLPGLPVSNEQMEARLGLIAGKPSRLKKRMLAQNGITTRHYALDDQQHTTHRNSEMAASAVRNALSRANMRIQDVEQLVAATSQGDLPLPGFGSMVHGELGGDALEVTTHHGVCASGLAAIKTATQSVAQGEHSTVAAVASELPSRLFKASRYEAQNAVCENGRLDTDTEFLRWMLSDGAGAVLIQDRAPAGRLSLRVNWVKLKSHAHRYPACMYVGGERDENHNPQSWLDAPDFQTAAEAGDINLRQNLKEVDQIVKLGVADYLQLVEDGDIEPAAIDHMLCHFSSRCFLKSISELATRAGAMIPEERWSQVMYTKGNTGSASLYLMLEDLLSNRELSLGQEVLCMVPESGRFTTGFMHLTVVDETDAQTHDAAESTDTYSSVATTKSSQNALRESLNRRLLIAWDEMEQRLETVPFVDDLYHGKAKLEDYRMLLANLRHQVIEGANWITRAVSSITAEHVEIRNRFIAHAGDEHLDYKLLEADYAACDGDLDALKRGEKNLGSEALSSFLFHRASQPNPWDMLGAMFIIEGLGQNMAPQWASLLQSTLELQADQVRFLTYHGANDENHMAQLDETFASLPLTQDTVDRIVKTARTTGRLYCLQLEEAGNKS